MKIFILYILMLISVNQLVAQHEVEGIVLDEDNQSLIGATVILLDAQDSSMTSFAISDSKGSFHLEEVKDGNFILQISFVSYKTLFSDVKVVGDDRKINIGRYQLEPFSEILREVTVEAAHIPMGVHGDTISYNAAAFKVKSGATVGDLLKKLPGIEVRRDGSIKAMGKDVQNVLVDGKEFFGDDPKIATQNLEAEAVDRVQLFDKKSEIAEFTGIDDGIEDKTINLQLKEGYKTGGFGKADISGGTEARYHGKINYNRFSPQTQASLIVGANNINKQAFSFNEYMQFMGGLGNAISSNNGMFNFGEFGGGVAPQGLTDNISTGLNYNYEFSRKLQLTSHYFYMRSDQNLKSITNSNQFTENAEFLTRDSIMSNKFNQNHRLNVKLKYKPNPFLQILWKNTLTGILGDNNSMANTKFEQSNALTNITNQSLVSNNDQIGYEGNIQYRKKYMKKGRNWINSIDYKVGSLKQENKILNDFLFNNQTSLVNQYQEYLYNKDAWSVTSAYTEPTGKKLYLGINYTLNYESEEPEKKFFDISEDSRLLNGDLSRDYRKTNTIHRTSFSLRKNAKKYKLNTSIGAQWTNIEGAIKNDNSGLQPERLSNNSFYLLPSMRYEYNLNRDETIRLSYNTSVRLPTLSQLAPLPDNTNPNLLVLGNPNLSPEYDHRINLSYSRIDQFNFKNLFVHASFDFIRDQIISEVDIDDQLIKTLTPINTDLLTQFSGRVSYSSPIRVLKQKFRTSANYRWSNYKSSINNAQSDVQESNISYSFIIENRHKDHIDLAAGFRMDYNIRRYEVNSSFDQEFFNYKLFVDGIFYIGDDWSISSNYDYVTYSGEFFSEGRSFNILNTSINKSFIEGKYSITLSIYDILNQNIGIERTGGVNALYETRYNTLSRYIMIGIKYKLGKKKKSSITFGG